MPGAIFSRVKTWSSTEDVSSTDLNAEFDNILNNLMPSQIDDYSANVTQMQSIADPGEVGTESLATTLAGEVQRLRSQIKEITGEDQWYESPVASLLGLANSIGTSGLTANRLVSGRERTGSDQPLFLVPHGAARTVTVDGTPTNFKYYVEGIEYTISTDVTLTSLTAAPSSNNTCLINDATAADQYWTKYAGEDGSEIPVDTMGSEISGLVGKYAAFKLDNGSTTEMFIAKVKSATALTEARRGYFFDSTDTPQSRIVYSNNDTITLLKLSWIFAKADGTLTVTYTNPVWSLDEPTSPAANDYWFDYANNKWKKFDVSAFVDADATLIGVSCQDTTNTIGARSFEFFKAYDELNTIEVIFEGNNSVRSRWPGSTTNVWGVNFKNDHGVFTWDTSTDLDTGTTDAASTMLYFYLKETGDEVISNVKPYDRREDLLGYYHPHHSWRCFGSAFNNGSSNFTAVESYYSRYPRQKLLQPITAAYNWEVDKETGTVDGSSGAFSVFLPPAAYTRGRLITITRTDDTPANAVTLDGFGAETIGGFATYALYTQNESVTLRSDGSNYHVLYHQCNTPWASLSGLTFAGLGTVSNLNAKARRRNDCFQVAAQVTTGTTTAADIEIILTAPYPIDSAKLPTGTTAGVKVGEWWRHNGTSNIPGTTSGPFAVFFDESTTDKLFVSGQTAGDGDYGKTDGNALLAASENQDFYFENTNLRMESIMWLDYAKERWGYESIEDESGFVLFAVRPPQIAIEEMYIRPELRGSGKGTMLLQKINQIGLERKCTHIWTQVWVNDRNANATFQAALRRDFRVIEAQGGRILLTREIQGEV